MNVAKDVRQLKRVVLTHVDDVEQQLRMDVLDKAQQKFGYVGESFGAKGPLAKVLTDCGIHVFDTQQVAAYMASKEFAYTYKPWDAKIRRRKLTIRLIGAGAVMALLAVWYFVFAASDMFFRVFPSTLTVVIGTFITAMLSDFANLYGDFEQRHQEVERKQYWKKFRFGSVVQHDRTELIYNGVRTSNELRSYTGYVPVHVLNEALTIKEAAPQAEFFVHELTLAERNVPLPQPDPFMEVALGSERYIFAVWDEREFA